jgi:tetratricopeptide (TPR) repeat protein
MRRQLLAVLMIFGCVQAATPPAAAAGKVVLLVAQDLEDQPLSGLRFSYLGAESAATSKGGTTELAVPADLQAGQTIKILLLAGSKRTEDWFLVNPQVNVPSASSAADVVLMRRSAFRKLGAETRDKAASAVSQPSQVQSAENGKKVLAEAAKRYGLSPAQLETAVASFAETQDPKDRGIAAYLEGQYGLAETLLAGAAEKKALDLADTLRYLGAAQFEQAKYRAAADSFRKALALRGADAALFNWLGISSYQMADWTEAEASLRRAVAMVEQIYGTEHPDLGTEFNNLAQLLQATNRPSEAEPLMRRALAIDEKSHGTERPEVARDLNNLAVLLQATNRLSEAEPLLRRALAIFERSYAPEHPDVGTGLNNLAQLLQATNRLREAEPLMRRALAIDEKSFGTDYPKVATDLNNLAELLQATNQSNEAESLLRRALSIDERTYGPEHPAVASDLSNLALVLHSTKRFSEAEPLMRRALAIDEKSYGLEHPDVARDLNNLGRLLQATNRLGEGEPLLHRTLTILFDFGRRTGHEHPNTQAALRNYSSLLHALGKSDEEIQEAIQGLSKSNGPK